jgi:demethylmenaquinone methyltransferase/2-methoxy-6-polyprenyl-1,4-benzoquinol methylase
MADDLDRSFGYEQVAPAERRQRIRAVFDAVAPRYDLMNDLMSFGIHRLWKRTMVKGLQPAAGALVVDLAGGTGDVARLVRGQGFDHVMVCDPSLAMMNAGRQRDGAKLGWLAGEAERLPLADGCVDTITVAFGLRNATRLEAALAEIHRALKPGGTFICLEFSRTDAWLRPFYDLYSFLVIPRLGAWVAGQPSAYHYLVESIRRFPHQQGFADMLKSAGFTGIRWRNLSFGIACLHCATRPATAGAA